MAEKTEDKRPTPDVAENNAFFPSPYSLSQFTSAKSDLDGADYPNAYRGGKWKILMIAADERYLLMDNGTMFSTGNHPVETLLPMYHLDKAGFEFDIATLSGNPVKFELWALPRQDEAVIGFYQKYINKLMSPLKLSDVVEKNLGDNSNYIAVFIPGGHGALIGIPKSLDVKTTLKWAMSRNKYIISLCHGPAAFLAPGVNEAKDDYIFKGYKICAFPDAIDKKTPELGYMPGQIPWMFGEELKKLGVEILNTEINGQTFQDRRLITGDSPFAANNVGKAAAKALLAEVGQS
ncbi:protein deglycase HchA [Bradyrhizobium sp. AUGA SZCCT0176]|uniref:glyoxalase III HchA n=1 Tax=Bradyrhizobium sp. AUGA SZCCT0176 TaxID=2807664 RepID=UPI001BA46909|nr:glyoxalase III HchA [Bradyrhizobium sp. AUGA SZCCT0176]MBR1225131.1 protein deglycase HchA [Bradyrhizobium sp. AUGA SZCCT0176]